MPSFASTLRRCHPAGRGLMNTRVLISGLVRPSQASLSAPGANCWRPGRPFASAPSRRPRSSLLRRRRTPLLGSHRGQHLVGGLELLARVNAAFLAPHPLAAEQVRAGQFRADADTARGTCLQIQVTGPAAAGRSSAGTPPGLRTAARPPSPPPSCSSHPAPCGGRRPGGITVDAARERASLSGGQVPGSAAMNLVAIIR
jgi:hypothetical protein